MSKRDILESALDGIYDGYIEDAALCRAPKKNRYIVSEIIGSAAAVAAVAVFAVVLSTYAKKNGDVSGNETGITSGVSGETDPGTETAAEETKENKPEKRISFDEMMKRITSGTPVYMDEITTGDKVTKVCFSLDGWETSVPDFHNWITMNRNPPIIDWFKLRYVYKYVTEDNRYSIYSVCTDNGGDPDITDSVIFAVTEYMHTDVTAEYPGASLADAEETRVTFEEAGELLKAGKSLRLCDVLLSTQPITETWIYLYDKKTGEITVDENGKPVMPDAEFAKNYKKALSEDPDGVDTVPVAETFVIYREKDGYKYQTYYTYIPAKALEDGIKLNNGSGMVHNFYQKYAKESVIFRLGTSERDHKIYYDRQTAETSDMRIKAVSPFVVTGAIPDDIMTDLTSTSFSK